jgi:hypothetical protein
VSRPPRRVSRASILVAAVAAAAAVAGCAGGGKSGGGARTDVPKPVYRPAGATSTVQVQAEVLPLGAVPYDNFSLPIVSPDGRYIATQSGAPPTIETAIAAPGSDVPVATQVEIYRLSYEREPPARHRLVGSGLLLGRSCNTRGFLVEAPQADGSRWIGFVTWESGDLTWLVTGEAVNAFASLGPLGQLAWSQQGPDAAHFDLVVRLGTSEWTVASQGDEWLMPHWSGKGDNLFGLHLREGNLDLVHAIASSPAAFRQSIRRLPLSGGATIYSAYQSMNAQVNVSDAPSPRQDRLAFYHPARQRATVWAPFAVSTIGVLEFDLMAPTALLDDGPYALLSTPENLVRLNMEKRRDRINLLAGMLVPRPSPASDWPYVLVAPGQNSLGLTAMRLLPRDERP